jgi:hypothetical protein
MDLLMIRCIEDDEVDAIGTARRVTRCQFFDAGVCELLREFIPTRESMFSATALARRFA